MLRQWLNHYRILSLKMFNIILYDNIKIAYYLLILILFFDNIKKMKRQKEGRIKDKIYRYLLQKGAFVLKYWGNLKGIPDLICCYKGCFLAIELKNTTKLTKIQKEVLDLIEKSGGYIKVLYTKNKSFEFLKNEIDDFIGGEIAFNKFKQGRLSGLT